MVFNLFKKTAKIHAGLDITSEGFTLVSLSFEKDKSCRLENFICKKFKEEIFQNGIITKPDIFEEILKKTLEENHFDVKTVSVCVSSNNMFSKTLVLPNLPMEELKIIAPQEASKHIPLTINEINVDFEILTQKNTKENKIDVILCALSKTIAKNIVESVAKTELEVESIDVASFAMIRTLANAEMINNPDLTYISVLIDYENTDINIIKNGMPIFAHNTQTGKKNIIEAITKSFEINREEAEKKLPTLGLVLPGMETSDNPDLHKASNATRSIYSNIASEIQKAIEFHNSQNGGNASIEKIILGGSGVCIQNIDKYITNKLKIQTELCNSLKNISHNLEISEDLISSANIPALSSSIGLALRHLSR